MDAVKFGAFIAATRRELGMTQAELAQRLHVTDKAVSKWERGAGFPDIHTLEPLADALGVSVLELMRAQRLPAPDGDADAALADLVDLTERQRQATEQRWRLLYSVVMTALTALLIAMTRRPLALWLLVIALGLPRLCFARRDFLRGGGQQSAFRRMVLRSLVITLVIWTVAIIAIVWYANSAYRGP